MSLYTATRLATYATLGDAHRMHAQDPAAFAAGVQYALDRLNNHAGLLALVDPALARYIDTWSAETLSWALDGTL
jgi:hypothetical protein